jgi:predicted transcriptional regulator
MKKLNNRNKCLILVSLIILAVIGSYMVIVSILDKTKNENLLMSISDISKNCISNKVLIYSNLEYQVIGSINNELRKSGKVNYKKDINALVDEVRSYKPDNEKYINYLIILNDGKEITASINDATELNNLLSLIPLDDLFFCD